jgi:hypothetical protein
LLLFVAGVTLGAEAGLELQLESGEATVGQQLGLTLILSAPASLEPELPRIGPRLGPFSVVAGSWQPPTSDGDLRRWRWSGKISAYRTGEQELPSIGVRVEGAAEPGLFQTEPQSVRVASVLDPGEAEGGEVEPADLKPPASIGPNLGPVWTAAVILGLLLLVSLGLLWLYRRHAARLAAAEVPDDPFHRTPPHVWVYAELQRLLERRLPERGEVELFYVELSRILKRYLGGRYRIDLLEHTTTELPALLEQGGTPSDSIASVMAVLSLSDRVKFAQDTAGPVEWKTAVESVYRIVDLTKPVEISVKPSEAGVA